MPSIETIYRETIRPLPINEQIRLADIIRKNVDSELRTSETKRSALEILNSIKVKGIFESSAEVDEHIRTERDSWDN